MKTVSGLTFDEVVKSGFHEVLKPLGFRKKANNFYKSVNTIGHVINIQKSISSTKSNILFTVNLGIFVPEYWLTVYNYHNKGVPDFPTEPECAIRTRIGNLKNQSDTWYEISEQTDKGTLIAEVTKNLTDFILPYFNRFTNTEQMLQELDRPDVMTSPLTRLILYGELRQFMKAKQEYDALILKNTNPQFLSTLLGYGEKYGIDK